MSDSRISLRPFTPADLPLVTPWFEDPDTGRFLGGPEWPAQMLALAGRSAGTIFRGARQIDTHHYLALADGAPAGYIDCGTFDRCTVYGGEGPARPILLETISVVTGSIAFAIDPGHRRRGLATQMITTLTQHPDLAHVELFDAGVEPENPASRAALHAAGFRVRSREPEFEGMLYYRVWRRDLIEHGARSA